MEIFPSPFETTRSATLSSLSWTSSDCPIQDAQALNITGCIMFVNNSVYHQKENLSFVDFAKAGWYKNPDRHIFGDV